MSLSFQNFEDTFSVPRRSFEADASPDVLDEVAIFTIPFGQLIFDIYYGHRPAPTGSPMLIARWDRRRQQLSEELKGETFTLPVDWAKDLYDQFSNPDEWKKTLIYPKVTFKDGSEKSIQLNSSGADLFVRAISRLVNQLLDYFEPKAVEAEIVQAVVHEHETSCSNSGCGEGSYITIQ